MDDIDELPLSKNTKILFNLLEVRIFDLYQSLQVASISSFIQAINYQSTNSM